MQIVQCLKVYMCTWYGAGPINHCSGVPSLHMELQEHKFGSLLVSKIQQVSLSNYDHRHNFVRTKEHTYTHVFMLRYFWSFDVAYIVGYVQCCQ